jgi:hypothetical protein
MPLLTRTWRFSLLTFVSLNVCAVACSKTNNVDQSETTSNTFEQVVGKMGGPVGDPNGLSVYIPAGALAEDTLIKLSEVAAGDHPAFPPEMIPVGSVYAFEPHGTRFLAPATLHLPAPQENVQFLTAYRAQPGGGWEQVSGQVGLDGPTAYFESISFSYYVLGQPDVAAPGSSGGTGASGSVGSGQDAGMMGGTAGTPGSGGTTGSETCPDGPDDAAPTATTADGSGMVNSGAGGASFTAEDGFAVLQEEGAGPFTGILSLVFTNYANACGYALALNSSVMPDGVFEQFKGGKQDSQVLSFGVRGDFPTEPVFPPGTYTMADGIAIRPSYSAKDASCTDEMGDLPPMGTVTIEEHDEAHVSGSIEIPDTGDGASFSGTFDFPFCEVTTEAGGGDMCCLP